MEIYKKLLEAKKEIGKISKDKKNPFFKSKYFDINQVLEHVEPILQKNKLLLLQPIEAEWVKSQIFDIETGEKVSSEIHISGISDPQKLGSAITYYRRYTLTSLLGLQAEDDDANLASKPTQQPKSKEDDTPVIWMSEGLFNKLLKETKENIKKTLDYYDGKTLREDNGVMKKFIVNNTYKEQLNSKL